MKVLDNDDNAVVAYCDYKIIDEKNNVIESVKSPDWNFFRSFIRFFMLCCYGRNFYKKKQICKLD
ncbi:hypothetical protein H263_15856 [Brachyspira hampsonii 30599]|nr:hypothetical protein H263_15856 [Brachyspira hampsonii 30599]